jgi:hypothetical protein
MPCENDGAFRCLGSAGPSVFPLAPGCMSMSGKYGPADEAESISTIQTAPDQGVTHAGHRRLLRYGTQRNAHWKRAHPRPPGQLTTPPPGPRTSDFGLPAARRASAAFTQFSPTHTQLRAGRRPCCPVRLAPRQDLAALDPPPYFQSLRGLCGLLCPPSALGAPYTTCTQPFHG